MLAIDDKALALLVVIFMNRPSLEFTRLKYSFKCILHNLWVKDFTKKSEYIKYSPKYGNSLQISRITCASHTYDVLTANLVNVFQMRC